jgi:hypothetical protein
MRHPLRLIPLAVLIALTSGCQSNDDRLVEMAREHAAQQAEQTRQAAKMHSEVVAASRQLVEADSRARGELASMQHELRGDQAEVGKQRDALEVERRQIAEQRRWDSVLGDAMITIGTLGACVLPLLAVIYLLRTVHHEAPTDGALVELLVQEVAAERPMLLPPSRALPAVGQTPSTEPSSDVCLHDDDGRRS